jgi:ribosomal protein L11 methyltransferase
MKTTGVSQLSIKTSFEAEEPIAALLETIFKEIPSAYSNFETQESTVALFTRTPPKEIKTKLPELEAGLESLREFGLHLGAAKIQISKVRREDWSESWKKYFKTIEIGRALMIKPSWSKQKALPGQAVVVLDPGLSFGTGQHATTSFCLREIVAQNRNPQKKSLLDIGCGSGILAISAAKLGYSPVEAFDFDPVAVRVAKKNSTNNRVSGKVKIGRRNLLKLPQKTSRKFHIICANLVADLLIQERDRILAHLAPNGVLVLAGILKTEFDHVRQRYEEAGLKLIRTKVEREWQSGSFKKG